MPSAERAGRRLVGSGFVRGRHVLYRHTGLTTPGDDLLALLDRPLVSCTLAHADRKEPGAILLLRAVCFRRGMRGFRQVCRHCTREFDEGRSVEVSVQDDHCIAESRHDRATALTL